MGNRDDRHNKRHNRKRPKTCRGVSGKWHRHLLMYARDFEVKEGKDGQCRPWVLNVVMSHDPPPRKPPNALSQARKALAKLEANGYVEARPSTRGPNKAARVRVNCYRLTPRGRECADTLLANDGKTPQKVEREAREARPRTPAYERYLEALKLRKGAYMEVLHVEPEHYAEAADLRRELEEALGTNEPDVNHPDVITRAAERYYVLLTAQLEFLEARNMVEQEDREGRKPLTEEELAGIHAFNEALGLNEFLDRSRER